MSVTSRNSHPHSKRSSSASSGTGVSTGCDNTAAEPSGSSAATPTGENARKTSPSTPLLTAEIPWEKLSPQSTAILRQVLVPMTLEGYSRLETAKRLGISQQSVRLLEDFFANEIAGLQQNERPDSSVLLAD